MQRILRPLHSSSLSFCFLNDSLRLYRYLYMTYRILTRYSGGNCSSLHVKSTKSKSINSRQRKNNPLSTIHYLHLLSTIHYFKLFVSHFQRTKAPIASRSQEHTSELQSR